MESLSRSSSTEGIVKSYTNGSQATWKDYVEITKPGINKSNLSTTFTGYFLAAGFTSQFQLLTLLFTLLGTGLVIAGGCTINNFYDRDIDPLMERTKNRSIPEGRIAPANALWYGSSLTLVGLFVLLVGVNPLAALLGLVGFLVYVFIYTMWLKRTSTLNTVIGGICGAVPPMMGWVAVTDSIDFPAWVLFFILFMWQPPHFFALALLKVDDYKAAGIPMLPVVKGINATKMQTVFFTFLLVITSFLFSFSTLVGWIYYSIAGLLGAIYLVLAVRGLFTKNNNQWARTMFFYSLIYLTVLMLALIIDVGFNHIFTYTLSFAAL